MPDRFCILPWVHMHAWPNGNMYPCCVSDSSMPLGNTNTDTIEHIWNGSEMRDLRKRMMANDPSPQCKRCYELEDSGVQTLRQTSNHRFAHHRNLVDATGQDGTSPSMVMAYLDIRFSNICNLRCRTCGPDLSSGWYEDSMRLDPHGTPSRIMNINRDGDVWAQLSPYLHQVEAVYFAGGEALLTDEHYQILDHWLGIGHTSLQIDYTTNFTVLDYKKRDIFEMWSRFENVRVAASLDASGARGEYLRKNMVWSQVVDNRRRMMAQAPDVRFEITPTVSAFNGLHLPDFHMDWVDQGLVGMDDLRINILTWPRHTSLRMLPNHAKLAIQRRVNDHIEWLGARGAAAHTIGQWESMLHFMLGADDSNLIPEFLNYHGRLDELRCERMLSVFPELGVLHD